MRFTIVTLMLAVAIGYVFRGRLRNLAHVGIRVPGLALLGIVLQFLPLDGGAGNLVVLASFLSLVGFVIVNLRHPGFLLILAGLALNMLVIGVNHGMPVTREALVASDQRETYSYLIHQGGTKHHLATSADDLLFLGDIVPVPSPIRQVVSVGDIAMLAGVTWFVVAGMRTAAGTMAPASSAATDPSP